MLFFFYFLLFKNEAKIENTCQDFIILGQVMELIINIKMFILSLF